MAVLDPQTLTDQAQEWCCIPSGDMPYAILAALIAVGEGDPMPTTNELMEQISCLKCAVQSGDVGLLTLGAVSNITGGGGGGSSLCGSGDPVAPPSDPTQCVTYFDTDTDSFWYWNAATAAWVQMIA